MKKQEYFKLTRKDEDYKLEKSMGYKVDFKDETGAIITLFFDNSNKYWNVTEYETGCSINTGFGCKTFKEAMEDAKTKISAIRALMKSEHAKQIRKIKFDLLCNWNLQNN